uniref:Ig-like domain-containing protein n=1 Tax=Denticeps clupeoides TaxID=299321 RepID=A0AAY4D144_9TELE
FFLPKILISDVNVRVFCVFTALLPDSLVTVVSLQRPFYPGDTVTLRCDITEYTDWYKYDWYRNDTQFTRTTSKTLNISLPHDAGQYKCYGLRSGDPRTSRIDLPTPVLTVGPQSPVFAGETVAMKCVLDTSSGWRYKWYKDKSSHVAFQSELNISGVLESHDGQYWCRGERKRGSAVTANSGVVYLSVTGPKPKPKLSSDRSGHVFTGSSVTLSCEVYQFYWYKDSLSAQVSDGGQYWCSAGRGTPVYHTNYSNAVWVNIRGECYHSSGPKLWSALAVVAVYALVTAVLGVKCYRARGKTFTTLIT